MNKPEPGTVTLPFYEKLSPEEKVEMLFRKYYAALCKSLYRTLRDSTLAEDIVQEVFLKVWEMRQQLKLDEAIQGYLYRSCYNTALNYLKKQKPQQDVGAMEVVSSPDTADKNLNLLETEDQILQAIDALPAKTKLVFSLSRYEELSYKEISDRLNISIKSVEKHMGIALHRLREKLINHLVIMFMLMLSEIL